AEAEAALNFRTDSITQKSPFESCRGYPPRIIPWPLPAVNVPAAADPLEHRHTDDAAITEMLTNAHSNHATSANKRRPPAPQYEEGDLVMLSSKNSRPDGEEGKLQPKWLGPYAVTKAQRDTENYSLQLPRRLQNCYRYA